MKYTLHLKQRFPYPDNVPIVELDAERILANDVLLPWESHPRRMRLFVIGNEFGAVCAVWATCEQDALDAMVDSGLGEAFLISKEDQAGATEEEREEWAFLGNASEPADLSTAWIGAVEFDKARDCELLCRFAEARGQGAENLDF